MKGRYSTDDGAEDDVVEPIQSRPRNAKARGEENRFQECANEHLYAAFQELHSLAQGKLFHCCQSVALAYWLLLLSPA